MLGLYAVRKHTLLIFQFFSSVTIFLNLKIIKAVVLIKISNLQTNLL